MLTDVREKSRYKEAFLIALIIGLCIFIPLAMFNGGIFTYYGDYNSQQIPFYYHVHDAIRNGEWGWDWYTDLGANFIGSYSFYELFSPFFWLTIPFPNSWVPYMMAPLLALKTACASLTSYFYVQRFTKSSWTAVAGSLMYAFSAFTTYNIFYNHFHEPIVFFPLLLIGLEDLIVENKRDQFLVAVAVNAIVNYWFFVMEVVFVMIYFFFRMTSWKWTFRGYMTKLWWVSFESVLGLLIAVPALLPSVLATMGNPRTAMPESAPDGFGWLVHWKVQRVPAIITSAFFPPEKVSSPNIWSEAEGKWSSVALWIPMASMCGAIGYWMSARKNWLKRLTITLACMALVPGLNDMFILFNDTFYTRWFYMFTLILIVATVIAIEEPRVNLRSGFNWTFAITLGLTLCVGLVPTFANGEIEKLGVTQRPWQFWTWAATALIGLIVFYCMYRHFKVKGKWDLQKFGKRFVAVLAVYCLVYVSGYLWITKGVDVEGKAEDDWFLDHTVRYGQNMDLPEDGYYRTDILNNGENYQMIWKIPGLSCFNSIVPASIMEFYPAVNVERYVNSIPGEEVYGLRGLLSVKYVLDKTSNDVPEMDGYNLVQTINDYNVYENTNYIPMGFGYQYYLTEEEFYEIPEDRRHLALVRAIVLNSEQEEKYYKILQHIKVPKKNTLIYKNYVEDCKLRNMQTCSEFNVTKTGFEAKCNLPEENLMFFSVPYDKGWSATVNGKPVEIEKVNIGFMAVPVPSGETEIVFTYRTPGLQLGLCIGGIALLMAVLYLVIYHRRDKSGKHLCKFDLTRAASVFKDSDVGVESSLENRSGSLGSSGLVPDSGVESEANLVNASRTPGTAIERLRRNQELFRTVSEVSAVSLADISSEATESVNKVSKGDIDAIRDSVKAGDIVLNNSDTTGDLTNDKDSALSAGKQVYSKLGYLQVPANYYDRDSLISEEFLKSVKEFNRNRDK